MVWLPGYLDLNSTISGSVEWDGFTATFMAGENLSVGDVTYLKSDGKMWLADADAESTIDTLLGIACYNVNADSQIIFLLKGFIRYNTWNWSSPGDLLWVHTTGGNPTDSRPTGSGDVCRIVGYAVNADAVFFDPDKTFIELR